MCVAFGCVACCSVASARPRLRPRALAAVGAPSAFGVGVVPISALSGSDGSAGGGSSALPSAGAAALPPPGEYAGWMGSSSSSLQVALQSSGTLFPPSPLIEANPNFSSPDIVLREAPAFRVPLAFLIKANLDFSGPELLELLLKELLLQENAGIGGYWAAARHLKH